MLGIHRGPINPMRLGLALAGIAGAATLMMLVAPREPTTPAITLVAPMIRPPAPPSPPPLIERQLTIKRNDTLGAVVMTAGLTEADAGALLAALLKSWDPRKLRPGHTLTLWLDGSGTLVKAAYRASMVDVIDLTRANGGFVGTRRVIDLQTTLTPVTVIVQSSLYDAFVDAGEDPGLAVSASDVLAWEIDFYRDVQKGDRLDMLVEKTTHDGALVRYGSILAIKYTGAVGTKELYRYDCKTGPGCSGPGYGGPGYYNPTGRSARRAFLKQPLPFVHITSRFGNRLHPILGYTRLHAGIDYGAPTGTPVWAVGDGVVTWAGMKGQNGNLISIRHSNGFTSHYAHLSHYGHGVRSGAHVLQKQVIGYVGATGLATGPHLHFALARGGHMVNPLNQHFPAGDPIPTAERSAFLTAIAPLQAQLGTKNLAAAPPPAATPPAPLKN